MVDPELAATGGVGHGARLPLCPVVLGLGHGVLAGQQPVAADRAGGVDLVQRPAGQSDESEVAPLVREVARWPSVESVADALEPPVGAGRFGLGPVSRNRSLTSGATALRSMSRLRAGRSSRLSIDGSDSNDHDAISATAAASPAVW